jgi:hypothetical protein
LKPQRILLPESTFSTYSHKLQSLSFNLAVIFFLCSLRHRIYRQTNVSRTLLSPCTTQLIQFITSWQSSVSCQSSVMISLEGNEIKGHWHIASNKVPKSMAACYYGEICYSSVEHALAGVGQTRGTR